MYGKHCHRPSVGEKGGEGKGQHGFQAIKMKGNDIFVRPRVPPVLEGK